MKKLIIICLLAGLTNLSSIFSQDVKVACIGNSITQGTNTVTFPDQLDFILGDGWDVQNFGVSGRTLLHNGDYPIWNETAFTNALNFMPDKVIIMLGTNDTKPYNWDDHHGEFYDDYLSMVDTFAGLSSAPEIWVCYPIPSFSDIFDIRDSVIVNGVIPLIDSVVANREVNLIDFYTTFEGKEYLTYDGIHPTTTGNNLIAEILFEVLVDSSLVSIIDENVLLNKPVVESSGGTETRDFINDSDLGTEWVTDGLPASITIDLQGPAEVDLFVVNFFTDAARGYQYTIEGSSDNVNWTILADQSEREDTVSYFSVDAFDPVMVNYIRFTVTSFVKEESDLVIIPEITALRNTGYFHAPAVGIRRNANFNFYVYFQSLVATGGVALYSGETPDPHIPMTSFYRNNGSVRLGFVSGGIGDRKVMVSKLYDAGLLISSDSIYYTMEEIVSEIKNNTSHNNLIIFPNPSQHGSITIQVPDKLTHSAVSIYDNSGRKIKTLHSPSDNFVWDRTDGNSRLVSRGIYHCMLENEGKVLAVASVIIQ